MGALEGLELVPAGVEEEEPGVVAADEEDVEPGAAEEPLEEPPLMQLALAAKYLVNSRFRSGNQRLHTISLHSRRA